MSIKRPSDPPSLARWLLTVVLPAEYRDAVLGDLAEEFDSRCRDHRITAFARAWYWRQVFHVDVWRLRGEARAERTRATEGAVGMRDFFAVELRQALRVFRRSPGFVSAVVVTLAVGIGGSTAIFSLINGLLLRPLPGIETPSRIGAVRTSEYGGGFGVSAYMDFLDFAERSRSFESLTAYKASFAGLPMPTSASLCAANSPSV